MTKTMKKILSVCLVVLMCITAAPLDGFVGLDLGFGTKASAVYAAGECGTNVKYSLDNGVLTISGTGPMKNYSTNESPFSGSTSTKITSVIINDGVTSIGNNVFNGCSSLKSVTIPNSVTSIGNNAFDCCTSLESVTIPNKVMSIGNSAFYYCTSLKSVTIPDSVTSIGDSAFSTCRVLKSITIPSKVTEINSSTFFSCKALESVTIPNSVTTINNKAFRNCTSLKTVYYGGCSENMWNKITIGEDNEKLTAANRTYADHKCSYTANKNVITGTCNNCSGVVSATLTVDEAVPRTYTGYAIEPLKVECVNLNTELEITYKNNINVGTASGSITIGGATATQTFEIEEEKAHTFGDVQYKNADCVNDGYDYKQCSICKKYFPSNAATNDTNGKDNIDDFKMEALGHLFIGGYHYKDADCLNTGYDYKQCSICKKYFPSNADEKATNGKDNTDDFVIEAKGHTFGNTIEVKPASCLEDGAKTAYKQCSICKKYFSSDAATNDTNGKDDTADFVIDATGHTFGTVQHKDADCLNAGYDYKQCTDCNKYFASDAAITDTNGKDDTADFVIDATGHTFGTVQHKDADCLNTGYDYKQCTDCNKYFASDAAITDTNGKDNTDDFVIEAKGHTFGNTIEVKPASCLEDGVKSAYKQCSICEKYFPSNAATNDTNGKDDTADFVIDATGHTFGTVQHKDADCLSTGYDYKQCTACKKYFASDAAANATNGKDDTSSFVIPVTGHSDGEDGNDNLCDNCYAYIGDITLTVGTNITVPITYAYGSRDTLVKFVPDKTAQYIITSNISSDDQNTYPVITVYSLTDGSLHYEAYDSADVGKNFNLSTYTFTAGQVYCITFKNYIENAEAYTVNVALGCEHPSSKQTCMGYYCDTCGLYYGSRDSSKHELDTVQTCSGYKCKHCNRYFGEAAPDNHIWSTEGMCTACFTWHDHKTFDENGMCTVCKYALPYILTSSGTTTYYQKLTDALTAAKDGDTIKMQNDDGEHYLGVEITKAITFDLNGHTMSTPSSDSFAVKANVTFTDSVGGSYCEYGIMLYTSCTFSGGGFRYIAISSDFETEDNLDDYLASCCDYYNYSYIFGSDGGGTVGSLVDLSSKKDTFDLENTVMIKTNHSIVEVSAQEATCTESGHTAGEYCENCDYTTVTKTSDPTGHTFGNVQHKDADCTSGGYDYKQCSSCNKYFAPDAATNATNGKQDYSSFTTQKLNHSYTGDIKMDSNGKNGTHSYKCVNGCGQYGGAVAHEWDNGEITTPASHLKEGLKTYKCACGAEYTEPISKLEGHSYTPTVVPPTCTEQGYTEHKCACGDSYKDTYVDATGHNYENGTCTECGDKDPGYTDGSGDNTSDCDCMCHSSNKFVKFIYKIVRSFWKLLKWHKVCDCGAIHY